MIMLKNVVRPTVPLLLCVLAALASSACGSTSNTREGKRDVVPRSAAKQPTRITTDAQARREWFAADATRSTAAAPGRSRRRAVAEAMHNRHLRAPESKAEVKRLYGLPRRTGTRGGLTIWFYVLSRRRQDAALCTSWFEFDFEADRVVGYGYGTEQCRIL